MENTTAGLENTVTDRCAGIHCTHTYTHRSRHYKAPQCMVTHTHTHTVDSLPLTLLSNEHAFIIIPHRGASSRPTANTGLNANSVLCNQQTGDNACSQFVTGTAHPSHECTMTAAQRGTSKRALAQTCKR